MSDGVSKILSKLGSKINKVFEAFLVQKYIVWRCDWELRGNEKVSSRTKPFNQIDYGDRSMAVTPPQRAAGERERRFSNPICAIDSLWLCKLNH